MVGVYQCFVSVHLWLKMDGVSFWESSVVSILHGEGAVEAGEDALFAEEL